MMNMTSWDFNLLFLWISSRNKIFSKFFFNFWGEFCLFLYQSLKSGLTFEASGCWSSDSRIHLLSTFCMQNWIFMTYSRSSTLSGIVLTKNPNPTWWLKITEKVSFNIASEASYLYILSGQKLIKNAKNSSFWRVFENLKLAVKQCYQTGQF